MQTRILRLCICLITTLGLTLFSLNSSHSDNLNPQTKTILIMPHQLSTPVAHITTRALTVFCNAPAADIHEHGYQHKTFRAQTTCDTTPPHLSQQKKGRGSLNKNSYHRIKTA